MSPDLSVITCTRNRSLLLRKSLGALVRQQCAPWTFEIIVVDNGSTDDTKSVVASFADKGVGLRYLYEGQKGIGHVRSVGFQASEGRYIAYLDDDAVPVPGWCAIICRALEEFEKVPSNALGALGGPIEPIFESGRPPWLSSEFDWAYAILDLGPKRRNFPRGGFPVPANMALLRSVHVTNTWDDSVRMCEDADLCKRIAGKGLKFFYIPEMKVHHFISERRLSREWLTNRYFVEGLAQNYLPLGFQCRMRLTAAALIKLPMFWLLSVFSPPNRRLLIYCKIKAYLGYWAGLLRIRDLNSATLDLRHALPRDDQGML